MALALRPSSAAVLVGLPTLAVVGVGFAFIGVAAPRSYAALRVYGGPTDVASELSWRVSGLERLGALEQPLSGTEVVIEASLSDGRHASWQGRLDALGVATAALRFSGTAEAVRGPIRVRAWCAAHPELLIARGEMQLTSAEWWSRARRRGGWLPVKSHGALDVRVAPVRGAWATAFADPLVIEVAARGALAEGVRLALHPEGVDVASGRGELTTDERGRVVVSVTPRESVAILGVDATAPGGATGSWYGTLPVATGALHAERVGKRLVVRSPVVRERAFYALVDARARLAGGSILLSPDGRGGSAGEVEIETPLRGPAWGVVSSESELDTASTIGWPLFTNDVEPYQLTFDVADRLLLDGTSVGAEREHARARRASLLGAAFAGLCLALAALFVVDRARTAERALRTHLSAQGAAAPEVEKSAPRMLTQLIVAVLCIALAATAFGLWLTWR